MAAIKIQKKWLLGIALLGLIIVPFQNCGEVSLTKANAPSASATQPPFKITLAPAIPVDNFGRLVLLLDLSNSAVMGSCPDEVDDPRYAGDGSPASPCGPGFDLGGDRFTWAEKWIQQLQAFPDYRTNSYPDEGLKILVVPYAGGDMNRPKTPEDESHMLEFESPQRALEYIGILRAQQQQYVAEGKSLGTSFVYKGLAYAYDKMSLEFARLGLQAARARWDVIIVGDGLRRPRHSDFEKFVTPCTELGGVIPGYTGYMVNLCASWVAEVKQYIGHPEDNNPNKTWFKAQRIYDAPRVRGFGKKVRLKVVQPHLENIPPESRIPIEEIQDPLANEDKINQMQFLKSKMKLKKVYTSSTSAPPFDLGGMSFLSKVYMISDFMVINLTARVNNSGLFVADSDGDSIPDDEETVSASMNARSDGVCLDGISREFGCDPNGCAIDTDADGDGLNECEENALRTSDLETDADEDGIPDLYELLYRTSLFRHDLNEDNNGDGISNKENFLKGATAGANILSVDPKYLIEREFAFLGITNGKARYSMQMKSIPLVNTRKMTGNSNPMWKGMSNPRLGIMPEAMLGTTGHRAGENEIAVLIKLVSQDEDDVYFFIARFLVKYENPVIPKLTSNMFFQVN